MKELREKYRNKRIELKVESWKRNLFGVKISIFQKVSKVF